MQHLETTFTVQWSGEDDSSGSALAVFTVYVSDNGGPFTVWLENTTLNEFPFDGQRGHRYAFYSTSRDNAGNVEAAPATPDAQTIVQYEDHTPPTSVVAALPTETHLKDFVVAWSGTDSECGWGVASYSVYVSADGGKYILWLDHTADTQAVYHGQSDHAYAFYCVATDNAGNVETSPVIPGAETTVPLGSTATWSGGGTAGAWSNSANWWGTPLLDAEGVRFSGTTQLITVNDRAPGTAVNGIAFHTDAGAFVLDGNAVALNGDVTNNSVNTQTINLPLVLVGGTRTIEAAAGGIAITGPITESGGHFGIVKIGDGTVTLSGANQYAGGTEVNGGTLVISTANALPPGGSLSIGAGGTVVLSSGLSTAAASSGQTMTNSTVVPAASVEPVKVLAAAQSGPLSVPQPSVKPVTRPVAASKSAPYAPTPAVATVRSKAVPSAVIEKARDTVLQAASVKRLAGDLAWLPSADQMTKQNPAKKRASIGPAVDEAIMRYWR